MGLYFDVEGHADFSSSKEPICASLHMSLALFPIEEE